MDPSALMRSILPSRLFRLCAFDRSVLAYRDVQLAVRTEMDGSAVVIGGTERFEIDKNGLAAGKCNVTGRSETADAVVDGCVVAV